MRVTGLIVIPAHILVLHKGLFFDQTAGRYHDHFRVTFSDYRERYLSTAAWHYEVFSNSRADIYYLLRSVLIFTILIEAISTSASLRATVFQH